MSIYSPETDIVDQSLTTRLMDYCELNFKRLAEENKKLRYFLHEAELHQEESDKTIITFRREVEQLGYDIINMADILARTGRPSPNDSHEDVIILADILATHYLHSTANQAINKLLIQRRRSAEAEKGGFSWASMASFVSAGVAASGRMAKSFVASLTSVDGCFGPNGDN